MYNMDSADKRFFSWMVKQGNIMVFADNDKIHLEINKENNAACLLTKGDAEELVVILTKISKSIWDNPNYTKEPYTGNLFRFDDFGKAYWDINETRLFIGFNDQQNALEMDFQGSRILKLSVNFSIEIIQVMTQFSTNYKWLVIALGYL